MFRSGQRGKMRIELTSDLHFDIGDPNYGGLRKEVKSSDVLVVAGDIGGVS